MATVTRTVNVTADSWYALTGAGNSGNGKGIRMAVGQSTNWETPQWQNRFAIKIPRGTQFDGIPDVNSITGFNIKLRAWDACFGLGGTVRFFLERATAAMAENGHAGDCTVSLSGTAGSTRWPGPARVTTDRASYSGSPTNGQWITVSALALGKWWYANSSVTELVLVGVAANSGLTDYEEDAPARRALFYTAQSSSAPYSELTFDDNQPPLIPTDPQPPNGSVVASVNGTSPTVSSKHTDPEGNAATKDEYAWYPTSATDATPGTPTADIITTRTIAHNAVRSHTFSGLPARTAGRWRSRFYDGQWGPWLLMVNATTAYQPSTPTNPSVTPATLTPDFFASLVSSDPADFITAGEVNVWQDPSAGQTITKWASGKVTIGASPTRMQLTYGGTALVYGTQYRWQTRLWNRDDVPTSFTGNLYFTPTEAIGPTITVNIGGSYYAADVSVKVQTLTPTIRLANPAGGNIDQYRLRYYSPTGTLLSDSGTVSFTSAATKDVVTPAGLWNWGQNPMIDAAIRPTGNADLGPFSPQKTLHINAQPGAPTVSVTTAGAVVRPDGVVVVDAATPAVSAPFVDADIDLGYVDATTRSEFEVRTLADAHFGASPYIDAAAPIATTLTLPTLTAETTYKVRARHDDNASVRSNWSGYLFVKRSAIPTLTSVTPAAAATITDPTPTIAWTYASAGSKLQATYRVTATVAGNLIYDSGVVASVATSVDIPAGILPNSASVNWTLDATDTDGLAATQIARTFTTSFTQPAALTGLVLTPNPETLAIDVAWTISALSDAEHEEYRIYARAGSGQFRLVKTISNRSTVTYSYKAAEHQEEVIIRLTQYNGYLESEPVEASDTLDVYGYWATDGSTIVELKYVEPGGFSATPEVRQEVHHPKGRSYAVVLDWGTYGVEGRISFAQPPEDDTLTQLRAWQKTGTVVLLKVPRASYYSKLRSLPETHRKGDFRDVGLDFTEVGPDATS